MKALDLFAGTGWGVALQELGIEEFSVDIMEAVGHTRELNGLPPITYSNVWDIDKAQKLDFKLLIGSPPCQTFSTAGNGSGRKALDDVLSVLSEFPYGDISALRSMGERFGDERTALVLSPLEYVHRYRPEYIALEQVPTVQPVWDAYKPILEGLGYSVQTGLLQAEGFGVAQTRKRAILLARSTEHGALKPVPYSHSRYNTHNPYSLDSGMPSWRSIEDELGNLYNPVTGKKFNFLKLQKQRGAAIRKVDTPAQTMAFGNDRASIRWCPSVEHAKRWTTHPDPDIHAEVMRGTIDQMARLQSYPEGFQFGGSASAQFLQVGNAVPPRMAKALIEHLIYS